MSLLSWIGLGEDLAKPIEALAKPIDAASKFYTTDKQRLDASIALAKVEEQRGLKQLDNNRVMAMATSLFESGWQSLVGWTAGACIALYYVPQLLIANLLWAQQCLDSGHVVPFPIDPTDILNLVYLLFGFWTYHLVKRKILG